MQQLSKGKPTLVFVVGVSFQDPKGSVCIQHAECHRIAPQIPLSNGVADDRCRAFLRNVSLAITSSERQSLPALVADYGFYSTVGERV